jgi:flagellar basal-body rod protein FlgF
MLRGIYSAASGLIADSTRLDVIANNLANSSTTGYKRDSAIGQNFHDMLLNRIGDRKTDGSYAPPVPIGRLGLGTFIVQIASRLTSGNLRHTGNPLDVAIMGDGFFTVQTPNGVRYSRQGSFVQDGQGRLTTPDGHFVLVEGQIVGERGTQLTITDDGNVLQDGVLLGRLDIATSEQIGPMKKEGGSLWVQAAADEAVQLVLPQRGFGDPRGPFQVRSGFLETSNVEPVLEMVEMITTMRSFEANQKAVQAHDEALAKAVNEVGRL